MDGEHNLMILLKNMEPYVNKGSYVFVFVTNSDDVDRNEIICEFKEEEGVTLILKKEIADKLHLNYNFVASWITLKVHFALSAVGLTAKFSSELAKHNISCNVVAGYYHDHIFVDRKDASKAVEVLKNLSNNI